jgi:hypothetical protein
MNSPQSEQPPAPRRNLRRCRRQAPKGSAKAQAYRNALGVGSNIATAILDVSETGARLLLKEQLRNGQELEVNFETMGARPIKTIAVVVWTVAAADGRFVTGVRFDRALRYTELITLARP